MKNGELWVCPGARVLRQARPRPEEGGRDGGRSAPDVEAAGVPRADIVIEAIFENADQSASLDMKLEPRMRPKVILATNTSSIVRSNLRGLADPGGPVGSRIPSIRSRR